MSIHPNGDGTGWTNVENVDVDQAHGKDYLYSQHIAKGIRKRAEQEHSTFADNTVGFIHTPGGCAVLGMEISDDGGDITTPVVGDGTYRARGLVWSWDGSQNARLWCATKAAGISITGDWTVLMMHPDKQWGGRDVTWTGAHEFDASVDISGNVAMDGDLTVDGKLLVDGTANFAADAAFLADASFDGTVDFGGAVAFQSDVSIGDATTERFAVHTMDITFPDGTVTGAPVHYGQPDILLKGWAKVASNGTLTAGYNATSARTAAGAYTISWTTPFSSANYAVVAMAAGENDVVSYNTQVAGSIKIVVYQEGVGGQDNEFLILAFGAQ